MVRTISDPNWEGIPGKHPVNCVCSKHASFKKYRTHDIEESIQAAHQDLLAQFEEELNEEVEATTGRKRTTGYYGMVNPSFDERNMKRWRRELQ